MSNDATVQQPPKPKIAAISLSWSANYLQRKSQVGPYSEFSGIETKVGQTAEKILAIGAEDTIVAYTNPEWLSPEKIEKKYLLRLKKLAKVIGYEIVEQRFDPRYPDGHPNLNGHSNKDQGTMYYKLKRNADIKPEPPKPKSDDELRMIGFSNAKDVKEGQLVEIRYTNSNSLFRKIGKVVRINPRSIRVEHNYEATHYFKQNTVNNAVFVIPEGREDEIRAAVDKFTADEAKKKQIIDEVLSQVEWKIEPAIRVHDEQGNEINSMPITELVHPTTVNGVKAKCQIEASEERHDHSMQVLGSLIDKKLKDAGLKGLV